MSPPELYIWIPRWHGKDGFQHYRDRDPIWIKNYTRLLSDDAYLRLTLAQRGLLHGIWLEYARSDAGRVPGEGRHSAGRLPGDTRTLSRRLGLQVFRRDLDTLCSSGFIEILASDVLAARLGIASRSLALARVKAETEAETEEPVPAPEPEVPLRSDPDAGATSTPPWAQPNGAGAGSGDLERLDPTAALDQARPA